MKLTFEQTEKQYIGLIIEDAMTGAKQAKAKNVVKEGARLISKFTSNSTYVDLKFKELDVITQLVTSSVEVLERILESPTTKADKTVVANNLEFAKVFSVKLQGIRDDQKERLTKQFLG